jgi:hypothetical protein
MAINNPSVSHFTPIWLIEMERWMLSKREKQFPLRKCDVINFLFITQILTVRNHFSLELDARISAHLALEKVAEHFFALGTVSQANAENVISAEEVWGEWKF